MIFQGKRAPDQLEPNFETHTHSHSHLSSSVSIEGGSSENFSMSREFSALVLAGSSIYHNITTPSQMSLDMMMHSDEGGANSNNTNNNNNYNNLGRIEEDEVLMMDDFGVAFMADLGFLIYRVVGNEKG